jgi:hypothetical protein
MMKMDRRQFASRGRHFIEVLQGQGRLRRLEHCAQLRPCEVRRHRRTLELEPQIEATSMIKTPTRVPPLSGEIGRTASALA